MTIELITPSSTYRPTLANTARVTELVERDKLLAWYLKAWDELCDLYFDDAGWPKRCFDLVMTPRQGRVKTLEDFEEDLRKCKAMARQTPS